MYDILRLTPKVIEIEMGSTDQGRTSHENRQSVRDTNVGTRSGGKRHRTDLGTKVKSDPSKQTTGSPAWARLSARRRSSHELAAECVDEDPMFSQRIYEKMYNGSRSRP